MANTIPLWRQQLAMAVTIERGVVDIESVKQANDALIASIDDALRAAQARNSTQTN